MLLLVLHAELLYLFELKTMFVSLSFGHTIGELFEIPIQTLIFP